MIKTILNWFSKNSKGEGGAAQNGKDDIDFHPKVNKPIQCVFEMGGRKYYRFVNDYEIPQLRFKRLLSYYNEFQMKCTKEYLNDFADAVIGCINVKPGEAIKLDKILQLSHELKYRISWSFEPDQLYRLASCVYFDLKEDITDYDVEYNKTKIRDFKKKGMLQYFLKELMTEPGNLLNLSEQDFQTYLLQLQKEIESQLRSIAGLKASAN